MTKHKKTDNVVELIDRISAHPGSYVGKEDLQLVASFIRGFVWAVDCSSQGDAYQEMMDFSWWLGSRFGRPRNQEWSMTLKDIYENDEKALEMLPKLFKEFLDSK